MEQVKAKAAEQAAQAATQAQATTETASADDRRNNSNNHQNRRNNPNNQPNRRNNQNQDRRRNDEARRQAQAVDGTHSDTPTEAAPANRPERQERRSRQGRRSTDNPPSVDEFKSAHLDPAAEAELETAPTSNRNEHRERNRNRQERETRQPNQNRRPRERTSAPSETSPSEPELEVVVVSSESIELEEIIVENTATTLQDGSQKRDNRHQRNRGRRERNHRSNVETETASADSELQITEICIAQLKADIAQPQLRETATGTPAPQSTEPASRYSHTDKRVPSPETLEPLIIDLIPKKPSRQERRQRQPNQGNPRRPEQPAVAASTELIAAPVETESETVPHQQAVVTEAQPSASSPVLVPTRSEQRPNTEAEVIAAETPDEFDEKANKPELLSEPSIQEAVIPATHLATSLSEQAGLAASKPEPETVNGFHHQDASVTATESTIKLETVPLPIELNSNDTGTERLTEHGSYDLQTSHHKEEAAEASDSLPESVPTVTPEPEPALPAKKRPIWMHSD